MASAPLIALNALGVVAAWAVLNTAYALYYAYIYYGDEEGSGGLEFPGDGEPGQLDFALPASCQRGFLGCGGGDEEEEEGEGL